MKHYLQVTDDRTFERAAETRRKCGARMRRNKRTNAAQPGRVCETLARNDTSPLNTTGCALLRLLCDTQLLTAKSLAERTGFEPADQFPGHRFSKPALSTTQPPLQATSSSMAINRQQPGGVFRNCRYSPCRCKGSSDGSRARRLGRNPMARAGLRTRSLAQRPQLAGRRTAKSPCRPFSACDGGEENRHRATCNSHSRVGMKR